MPFPPNFPRLNTSPFTTSSSLGTDIGDNERERRRRQAINEQNERNRQLTRRMVSEQAENIARAGRQQEEAARLRQAQAQQDRAEAQRKEIDKQKAKGIDERERMRVAELRADAAKHKGGQVVAPQGVEARLAKPTRGFVASREDLNAVNLPPHLRALAGAFAQDLPATTRTRQQQPKQATLDVAPIKPTFMTVSEEAIPRPPSSPTEATASEEQQEMATVTEEPAPSKEITTYIPRSEFKLVPHPTRAGEIFNVLNRNRHAPNLNLDLPPDTPQLPYTNIVSERFMSEDDMRILMSNMRPLMGSGSTASMTDWELGYDTPVSSEGMRGNWGDTARARDEESSGLGAVVGGGILGGVVGAIKDAADGGGLAPYIDRGVREVGKFILKKFKQNAEDEKMQNALDAAIQAVDDTADAKDQQAQYIEDAIMRQMYYNTKAFTDYRRILEERTSRDVGTMRAEFAARGISLRDDSPYRVEERIRSDAEAQIQLQRNQMLYNNYELLMKLDTEVAFFRKATKIEKETAKNNYLKQVQNNKFQQNLNITGDYIKSAYYIGTGRRVPEDLAGLTGGRG